jgi:hypothetical protein
MHACCTSSCAQSLVIISHCFVIDRPYNCSDSRVGISDDGTAPEYDRVQKVFSIVDVMDDSCSAKHANFQNKGSSSATDSDAP